MNCILDFTNLMYRVAAYEKKDRNIVPVGGMGKLSMFPSYFSDCEYNMKKYTLATHVDN